MWVQVGFRTGVGGWEVGVAAWVQVGFRTGVGGEAWRWVMGACRELVIGDLGDRLVVLGLEWGVRFAGGMVGCCRLEEVC